MDAALHIEWEQSLEWINDYGEHDCSELCSCRML